MRKFPKVLALIFLIVAVAALVLRWRAGRYLDARAAELEGEVAAFVAAHPAERPVVLGPATDGNAVDAYREIERAWAPRDDAGIPRPIPRLTNLADRRDEQGRGLDEYLDGDPSDIPTPVAAFLDEQSRLEAHVREGLQRRTCDWDLGTTLEDFVRAYAPSFIAMRQMANLMAAMAHRTRDPEEALRLGIEIVGFGCDLGRGGTLIMQMMGNTVVDIGAGSLSRTLNRFPISLDRSRRLADDLLALDAGAFPLSESFRMEQLGMEWWLARRRSIWRHVGGDDDPSAAVLARWTPALFYAWELPAVHATQDLAVAASRQPFPRMQAEQRAILDRAAHHPLALALVPNVVGPARTVASTRARVRAAALLAIAAGARNDLGALPASAEALSAAWGRPLPEDPYAGGTMRYEVLSPIGAAAAYGAGPDGEEGEGELHALTSLDGAATLVEVEGTVAPLPDEIAFAHGSRDLPLPASRRVGYVRLDAHGLFVGIRPNQDATAWTLDIPYPGPTAGGAASGLSNTGMEPVGLVLLPRE